jgi:DNA-binding MarR family transcriptional regulator
MPMRELATAAETLARAQRETAADVARSVDVCRSTVSLVRLLDGSDDVTLGQVAATLRVDLSVASRQVSQAVTDGHVERTVDTDDRRVRTLRLTPEGTALAARVREEFAARAAVALAGWTDDDLRASATTLRRLADALTRTTGTPARASDES